MKKLPLRISISLAVVGLIAFTASLVGANDQEDRAAVEEQLKSSPEVRNHFGRVQTISSFALPARVEESGSKRSGRYGYRIRGEKKSDTITVYWQRPAGEGRAKLTKVVVGEVVILDLP